MQRLKSSAGRNWHVAAVCSGGTDSTHLAFVSRIRRENEAIFLAVFDRDASMSAESRTMLQGFPNATADICPGRGVDMVTCWTDHLIDGLKEVVSQHVDKQHLQERLKTLEGKIRQVFDHHDQDNSGLIEEHEYYTFAVDVAELIEPAPGEARSATITKVFDVIKQIDSDHDGSVSWPEFWGFITRPVPSVPITADKEEKPWHSAFGAYVMLICQRADGGFLLTHQQEGWWVPGTEIAPDETPHEAATRCCMEQANLAVRLEGVLRTEFDSRAGKPGTRVRMIFLARALNDYDQLKTIPDKHSSGAVWCDGNKVTLENDAIPLAGNEPAVWFDYILRLGPVYPLSVIASEGAPPSQHPTVAKANPPYCTDAYSNPPFQSNGYHGSEGAGSVIEVGGQMRSNLGVIYPNSPCDAGFQ